MRNWGRGAGHPALLPWYVAGTLPVREARSVLAHVARCAVCQRQVRDVAAQRAALLGSTRTDHPAAEELVAFTDSDPTVPADRRQEMPWRRTLVGVPAAITQSSATVIFQMEQPKLAGNPKCGRGMTV
jgi:anti-sigma factor RsiW